MIVRGVTPGGELSTEVATLDIARRFIAGIEAICPWPIEWQYEQDGSIRPQPTTQVESNTEEEA